MHCVIVVTGRRRPVQVAVFAIYIAIAYIAILGYMSLGSACFATVSGGQGRQEMCPVAENGVREVVESGARSSAVVIISPLTNPSEKCV